MAKREQVVSPTPRMIENLCAGLTQRATTLYREHGEKFDPLLTSPPHFQRLSTVINAERPAGLPAVQPEWLRNLFYKYRRPGKPQVRLNIRMLDSVSHYVAAKLWKQYESELERESQSYYGDYNLWWRGTMLNDASRILLPRVEYRLSMSAHGSFLRSVVNTGDEYSGEVPEQLRSNVYVELRHPDNIEKVYIVLHVGIAPHDKLSYTSGLLLGVDNQPHPVACPVLLVRTDQNPDEGFIKEYFSRFDLNLKALSIDRMGKMLIQLQSRANPDTLRLSGLIGVWIVYTQYRDTAKIEISKLQILGDTEMIYESSNVNYTEGKMSIVGSTSVLLQMHSEVRHVTVIANIGHQSRLSGIRFLYSTYCSTGNNLPISGISILERTDSLYESIQPRAVELDAPDLDNLRKNGVLKTLEEACLLTAPYSDAE